MEKKLTPLSKLIENIYNRIVAGEELGYKADHEGMSQLYSIRNIATELLQDEKKAIEDAYFTALTDTNFDDIVGVKSCNLASETYFKNKYENNY